MTPSPRFRTLAVRLASLAVACALMASTTGCAVVRWVWHPRPSDAPKVASAEKPAAKSAKKSKTKAKKPRRGESSDAPRAGAEPPRRDRSKLGDAREQAALSPAQPYWPYREATLLFEADSTEAAERALRESLRRDPDYAPSLARWSKLMWDEKRHVEAIERLEAARARRGTLAPELAAGLALHYDAVDRPDRARDVLATLAGDDARGTASARTYVTLRGEHPEAATDLAVTALGDDPKSAAAQNNYGIARLRAGDPVSAKKAFQKALDLDPRLPGPHYNLAILEKFYLLDDEAAEKWIASYWKRATDDPDSLRHVFEAPARRAIAREEN